MKKQLLICILFLCFNQASKAQDSLKYSKKQVADDITYLFKNAVDIHPNLYHDISPQQLARRTDSLISKLPDSLSVLSAYSAFAEATAFINEGHTGVNTPRAVRQATRSGTLKMIPLQVTDYSNNQFEGKLIFPEGDTKQVKVTSINGMPSANIYKQLLALKGGLTAARKAVVTGNFRFFLAVLGISQPYRIAYADEGKAKQTITLNGISESEYTTRLSKPATNTPYSFAIDKDGYGYLNFKSMNNYDKFTRFCDSIFEVISHQQIKKLVVDLRENSGGNSALGRYLLNYLTNKSFRMAGESERKVSQQFRTYITANRDIYGSDYDGYLKLPNGSFYKMGIDELDKPEAKPYKYKGKVCFLISPYTFSSANMLAAAVKDYKLSTLIGEQTGEPANDYGELLGIDLPNTGLTAFTSTTFWVRPNNDKADHNPIMPDYLVKRGSNGNDNVLGYAVKWLEK